MRGWMRSIVAGLAFVAGGALSPAAAQPMIETLGDIHWYGLPARCTYQTPEVYALFRRDDPETWRFVFFTMLETGEPAVERGYVLVGGALRELEKVRSGQDTTGRTATVWRSAGSPPINVNLTLAQIEGKDGAASSSGRLTLIAGDGRREVDIVGHCG